MVTIPQHELPGLFAEALRGLARLQARQEMMECVVRAVIAHTPVTAPLWNAALHTAKSDREQRSRRTRAENPPETDRDALALWNELMRACAPPEGAGTSPRGT